MSEPSDHAIWMLSFQDVDARVRQLTRDALGVEFDTLPDWQQQDITTAFKDGFLLGIDEIRREMAAGATGERT